MNTSALAADHASDTGTEASVPVVTTPTLTPVVVTDPALTVHASHQLRATGRAVGKQVYDAWVESAAVAVVAATLTDVRAGALPGPHEQPAAIEAALATRAADAVSQSSYVEDWPQYRGLLGALEILSHARCGPAGEHGAWRTWVTPFVQLTVDAAPTGDGADGTSGVCVVRPGGRHDASALGFAAVVDWEAFAQRVLRDDVLCAVARHPDAQRELLVYATQIHGSGSTPCRVGAPPTQPLWEPPSRSRRRRR